METLVTQIEPTKPEVAAPGLLNLQDLFNGIEKINLGDMTQAFKNSLPYSGIMNFYELFGKQIYTIKKAQEEKFVKFCNGIMKYGLDKKTRMSMNSYFYAGFAAHSYLEARNGLNKLFETLFMLHRLETSMVILDDKKKNVFISILKDPKIKIEKELNKSIAGNEIAFYDENGNEIGRTEVTAHVEETDPAMEEMYNEIEALITENNTREATKGKLELEDYVFWGYLAAIYPSFYRELYQKICLIRELEVTKALNFDQKLKLMTILFHNLQAGEDTYLYEVEKQMKAKNDDSIETSESENATNGRQGEEVQVIVTKPKACEICLEDLTPENCMTLELCGHVIHKPCLEVYVKMQLEEKKVPIKCPQDNCNCEIMNEDLKKILPIEEFKKLMELEMALYMSRNMQAVFQCRTSECKFKLFELKEEQFEVTCPLCQVITCVKCGDYGHGEKNCEVNQFMNAMREIGCKACPSCRLWVEKIDGCNHMTCACGYEFCFNCGRMYYAFVDEEGNAVCANGYCQEEEYYDDQENLLNLQES